MLKLNVILFSFLFVIKINAQQVCFYKHGSDKNKCYNLPINAVISLNNNFKVENLDTIFTDYSTQLNQVFDDSLYIIDLLTSKKGAVKWSDIREIRIGTNGSDFLFSSAAIISSAVSLGGIAIGLSELNLKTDPAPSTLLIGLVMLPVSILFLKEAKHNFQPEKYRITQ